MNEKPRLARAGNWLMKGYGLLLTAAASGYVVAQLGAMLGYACQAFLVERMPAAGGTWVVRRAMHGGWIVGVVLALAGAFMAARRRRGQASGGAGADATESSGRRRRRTSKPGRRYGPCASLAIGGALGALLGGIVGASWLMLWFSLACSPLAPSSWASSISKERRRMGVSGRKEVVATTRHPAAAILWGVPLVTGAVGGGIMGLAGGVREEA